MNPLGDAILHTGQGKRSNVQGPAICQTANTIITCVCVHVGMLAYKLHSQISRLNVLFLAAQSTAPPLLGDIVL